MIRRRHAVLSGGLIQGGTNSNVVPGKVVLKLDRRMICEESPVELESALHSRIDDAMRGLPGFSIYIRRLLMAHALAPLPGNQPLVQALYKHASALFGETIEGTGTPLYTDAR